ncbi:hypothetical protein G6F22_015596 [Rhizopus arrhizus]|nr:hypothetical protein G6F22_015596 [Rhizopus arrhizus]
MVPSNVAAPVVGSSVVSQNGRVTSRQYSSRRECSIASVEMNVSEHVMLTSRLKSQARGRPKGQCTRVHVAQTRVPAWAARPN